MPKISNKNKAFSLTELLVVIAIIAILSVIVFPYYQSARKQFALQRSANKLAQDIRRAQGMALGAETEVAGGGVPEGGYGIYLKKVPPTSPQKSYILFADQDDDHRYDPISSEEIEEIFFEEEGIKIKDLDSDYIHIVFKPPDPKVYLTNGGGGDLGSDVFIEICLIDDCGSKTKTIKVNKAGLIYVE